MLQVRPLFDRYAALVDAVRELTTAAEVHQFEDKVTVPRALWDKLEDLVFEPWELEAGGHALADAEDIRDILDLAGHAGADRVFRVVARRKDGGWGSVATYFDADPGIAWLRAVQLAHCYAAEGGCLQALPVGGAPIGGPSARRVDRPHIRARDALEAMNPAA